MTSVQATGGVDYGDTIFTDKKENTVTAEDFLQLMVVQLQNQDFMNPVDDTQYVTQLAQFTTMQQMTELAEYSKQSYVMSLIGKEVTAAKQKISGELDVTTGTVDKISLVDGEYEIYIGDKSYNLSQIMEIGKDSSASSGNSDGGMDDKGFLLSLMGQTVTVKNDDLEVTGVVEMVQMENGKIMVNGDWYTIDSLVSVGKESEDSDDEDEDSGSVEDVEKPGETGNTEDTSGTEGSQETAGSGTDSGDTSSTNSGVTG